MIVRITAKHMTAGIIIEDGVVTKTAPILKYMKGWILTRVITYGNHKQWKCELLEESNESLLY